MQYTSTESTATLNRYAMCIANGYRSVACAGTQYRCSVCRGMQCGPTDSTDLLCRLQLEQMSLLNTLWGKALRFGPRLCLGVSMMTFWAIFIL